MPTPDRYLSCVGLEDALGNKLVINEDGSINTTGGGTGGGGNGHTIVDESALPEGAATAAKQDSIVAALGSPLQAGGSVSVANFPAGFLAAQSGAWTVGLTGAHVTIDNVSIPVTGIFWQATQPVSGTFWQATQPVSGPLTDTQLRATTVHVTLDNVSIPVTGTFWQATQPVSGTFWQATQPVSIAASVAVTGPLTDTQLRATAVPISGTFWQATQPVSLVSVPTHAVTQSGVWTVGVTGTFWQATQPVSIASMPSTPVTGIFWQATQPVSGPLTDTQLRATAVPISAAALPLPTGAAIEAGNLATLVSQLAFQLASNRQPWSMSALLATGATSEALLSSVVNANGVNAGAANTYTVPVGKTLRIMAIEIDVLNTTTVANRLQVNLRGVASGTATASSPLLARVMAAAQAALAAGGGSAMIDFPEGLCIPAGWSIGLSQICSVTTASIVSVCVTGYLY